MMRAALALFAVAMPALAQDAPAVAEAPASVTPDAGRVSAATRLLAIMDIDRQYDSILGQMIPVMSAQVFQQIRESVKTPDTIRRKFDDPAQSAKLREVFAEEVTREFRVRYGKMRAETAQEYARLFTAEELNELAAFYERPVGRKALEVMPQLQQRLFPIGMRVGAEAGRAAMATTLERVSLDGKRPSA